VPCILPPLGIMAEVPAVAIAPEMFPQTAFFSIGSNDLTQYVMAASRDNGELGSLSDGANPAVLKLMGSLVDYGQENAVPISICGDMASDASKLQALIDCGLRRFSVAPARLAQIKRRFSEIS
jgi:phosphoenolpyruvate-protein phosphotransferase (PTS system enzyme I)